MPRMVSLKLKEHLGVPRIYWDASMEAIQDASTKTQVLEYVESSFVSGVYLHGTLGVGKSAISSVIFSKMLAENVIGVWLNYFDWQDWCINKPIFRGLDVYSCAMSWPALVLDDLNVPRTAHISESIEKLLRNRVQNNLLTIVSSNFSIPYFCKNAPVLGSLLRSLSTVIEVKGSDLR